MKSEEGADDQQPHSIDDNVAEVHEAVADGVADHLQASRHGHDFEHPIRYYLLESSC